MDNVSSPNASPAVGRPMLEGIDTLFAHSWQTYQQHFVAFLRITAIMFIPAIIMALWAVFGSSVTQLTSISRGVITAVLILITFVVSMWGSLALLRSVQQLAHGATPLTMTEAYRQARSLLLPYLWIGILMAVIILLYVAVPLVLGLLLVSPSIGLVGNILPRPSLPVAIIASVVIVGLSIAGGVMAFFKSIAFSQSYYLLLEQDLRGMTALRASQSLVKGYWWAVLGRFIVLGLVLLIAQAVVSAVFNLFDDAWVAIAQIVFNVLVAPFSIIYGYGVFRSLRAVKPQ